MYITLNSKNILPFLINKKSGIYQIRCLINNKVYVGKSTNLKARFKNHKNTLKNNTNRNRFLQKDWNKYGESFFVFEIIEFAKESCLLKKEKEYIGRASKRKKCYNIIYNYDDIDSLILSERKKVGHRLANHNKTTAAREKASENTKKYFDFKKTNNPFSSQKKYLWENIDGRRFYGSAEELTKIYPKDQIILESLYQLITKLGGTYKNWYLRNHLDLLLMVMKFFNINFSCRTGIILYKK